MFAYALSVFLLKTYSLFQTQREWTLNITNVHDFSQTFGISVFPRTGNNNHFKIPWLFQVFHDRTNPDRDMLSGTVWHVWQDIQQLQRGKYSTALNRFYMLKNRALVTGPMRSYCLTVWTLHWPGPCHLRTNQGPKVASVFKTWVS